jgi:hypothetical protein
MKLDRAGAKYSVNFWVLPNRETKITYGFFIGFRSILPADAEAATVIAIDDLLRQGDLPMEVRLTKLGASTEQKIQLSASPQLVNGALVYSPLSNDLATIRTLTNGDSDEFLAKKLLDASKRYAEFEIAVLQKAEPGYYRLDVRVLKDNAETSKLALELLVSNYYKGK